MRLLFDPRRSAAVAAMAPFGMPSTTTTTGRLTWCGGADAFITAGTFARTKEGQLVNGRTNEPVAAPRLVFPKWRVAREATMADLTLAFIDRARSEDLSPATQRYYRQTSDHWLRFCEQQRLTDPREVSPDHLTAYAGWLQAGGNNKQSIATWLRGVRALMSWAELRGFIELSPFRLWKLKQPKLPAQRGFGAADVRRMIDVVARQLANPLRGTAIILLLFDTGIRRSETCRLRLNDVIEGDHMASSVTVQGKGDKYRRIELHPQTQRAIFEYLVNERPQKARAEALFLGRGAHGVRGYHQLTVDGVSQIVERIARRAGLDGTRLGPRLRHGFYSRISRVRRCPH
jgi:integrase/recombinase XerD